MKHRFQKTVAVVLSLMLCLSLVLTSCGGAGTTNTTDDQGASTATDTAATDSADAGKEATTENTQDASGNDANKSNAEVQTRDFQTQDEEAGAGADALADIDLSPAAGFKQGGTLKISGYYDPPPALTGNQFIPNTGYPGNMKEFTYVKLFDYAPLPKKVYIPWLATGYTQEGNKITITLDPSYKWSDGTPVTAQDVVCTFNMKFIFNEQVWKYLEDIKAIDDTTIELTWKREGQYLLVMANSFYIDCPYAVYGKWSDQADAIKATRTFDEGKGEYVNTEESNTKLVSIREDVFTYTPDITQTITNSMYVVTNVNASDMTAERNSAYPYGDKVAFDKIILQRYVSIEAWLSTVMAGGYDVEPHGTTPDLFAQLEQNNKDMKVMWTPDLGQPSFQFNLQKYPMNIPEVRKAIALAIDKEQLLYIAEPGTNPGDQYITGLTPKWRDVFLTDELKGQLEDYTYNTAKAEELLTSIGWTKGNGGWQNEKGEVVEIEVSSMNSWPIYFVCGDAITNMLNDFGFKAKFNAMELSSYWTYIDNGEAMISADFRGNGHTFGYWEAYKGLYLDAGNRIGYLTQEQREADPNAPIMVKDAEGKEYNMRVLVGEMFASADNEAAKETVVAAMKATNELVPFIPFGEKWSPIKIHNPKLAGYPIDSMDNPLWYCPANMVGIVRLIRFGKIYYED